MRALLLPSFYLRLPYTVCAAKEIEHDQTENIGSFCVAVFGRRQLRECRSGKGG